MAGCDSGPESGEIEETLSDKVRKVSDKPVDITCPEDSASTEVGETIDCRIKNSSGEESTVAVTNMEDSYSWSGAELLQAVTKGSDDSGSFPLGAGGGSTPSAPTGPCIILGTGNKLCGQDAIDWCYGQDWSELATEDVSICNDVTSGRTPG